ncbi:ThiF family adenylyltransferase [Frigoribacterium salinisoli]
MKVQLKPYLAVRRAGTAIRLGNMPPRGIEIDDAPEELDDLLRKLSSPRSAREVAKEMNGAAGVDADGWLDTIDTLIEAGVVGSPIPDDSRYARHLLYFDLLGLNPADVQERLKQSTVAVVGTGGIGSNVATLLAAAGVGRLILTDGDTIEFSNLKRQVLYDESTIGEAKVQAARRRLHAINSEVEISTIEAAASEGMFLKELQHCDAVMVSADSPDEIHKWVDAGARSSGYAYITAGYIEGHGTVGPMVLPGSTACYECMRADSGLLDSVQDDGGNLNAGLQAASYGPLNLIIASMAANETIRLIGGAPCETAGRRILIDSRNYEKTTEDVNRLADCQACGSHEPHVAESTAVVTSSIESVYAENRSTDSINKIVLDDFLHEIAQPQPGQMTFDYGCGSGDQAIRTARAGASVHAFDVSTGMLEQFRGVLQASSDLDVTLTHDLRSVPSNQRFDLIMCTNVLDLIAPGAVEEAVGWMADRLSKDGRLLVTVPHPIKDGARWIRTADGDTWRYEEMRLREYFEEKPIEKHWESAAGDVSLRSLRSYHRTVETYFSLFRTSGLSVNALYEPQPTPETAVAYPEIWAKTSKVPYFLTFDLRSTT